MRVRHLVSVIALVLSVAPVRAQQPKPEPKVVKETWDAAYLEGVKTGYFHSRVVEVQRGQQKLLVTTQDMSLKILRDGAVVTLRMEAGCEEKSDGSIVSVSATQYLGPAKLTIIGKVTGRELVVQSADGKELKRLPWDDKAIGLYAQDRLWKDKRVKPGDKFQFTNFELLIEKALLARATVGEMDETDVLEQKKDDPKGKADRVKRKLLRVEVLPDKVDVGGMPLQLPKMVSWLNADLEIVRGETEMPGLGRVVTYRTTKEIATSDDGAPALLPDLLLTTLVPVDKRIDNPHEKSGILLRITYTGEGDVQGLLANELRQQIENIKGNTFEVRLAQRNKLVVLERPMKTSADFLKSNHFLDSADATVRAHATRAVGGETDPWQKAVRIEKWVHDNMTGTTDVVFATASQVAKDLRGDCRQHAMLAAAMCRAAGVPSRTAVGLVYYDDLKKGPVLAFHMWTEVYIRDQWLAIDATLGRGGVGAPYLKVADHGWQDTQTLLPLLPVLRVLGKIKVEVIEAK
jgi:hypothetical protein